MRIFQFLFEGIRFAIHAIGSNKLRTFLTMLGVAIGIFAITGILSMVNSLEYSITKNLSALGNTTMFVHNWPWKDVGEDWYKYWGRPKVSYKDYTKVKNELNDAEAVYYEVSKGGQTAKFEGKAVNSIVVTGCTEDMGKIKVYDLTEGRNFSQIEFFRGANVCMLGYEVAKGLFDDKPAVGKSIRVGGDKLKVIGVYAKRGISLGGPSEDEIVYVPYKMVTGMYNINQRWGLEKMLTVKAISSDKIDYVESELIGLMRASRGLRPQAEDNFSINKQEMLMNMLDSFFESLRMGGGFISIFSLFVSLFSIGLIMYISVRERTKEIGIQKSLGSTKGFILYQFLVEALIICLLGGLIGLGLVTLTVTGFQAIIDNMELPFTVAVTTFDIVFSLGTSLVIGLLAGIIPAGIAASVDPVIAIRFK